MYERHFGLDRPPFRITPDPAFFFGGGNRGAVLEALCYAIARGEGIVKVVGEVGSGKTMLCRMLERELPPACERIYLANPHLAPGEIPHAIAFELGLAAAPGESRLAVMHRLQAYLLERHAAGRRVVLFVEEAQGMPLETLEEIRLLSNLETSVDKLLQIVLFGQPELDQKLNDHAIRQLRERITHAFELAPLGREGVRDYVNARLAASGHRGDALFDHAAIALLTRASGGLLRRINVLADKALLAAFADQAPRVSARHLRRALRDSEFAPRRRPWARPLAAAALLVAVGAGLWLALGRERVPLPAAAGAAAQATPAAPATVLPAAVAPPAATSARPRQALPTVSPTTGLVGTGHLAPLLDGPAGGHPDVPPEASP